LVTPSSHSICHAQNSKFLPLRTQIFALHLSPPRKREGRALAVLQGLCVPNAVPSV
jgi:hypothetical protein